jgi:hypothetical protein
MRPGTGFQLLWTTPMPHNNDALIRSDDPRRNQIVNLVQADLLGAQFFPDRIETFDASFDQDERHFRLVHLLFDAGSDALQKRFVLGTSFFELFGEFAIVFG